MLWEFINVLENFNYEPTDLPKETINFIHIYEDGSSKIMDYETTDFTILTDQPKEFLIKEDAFVVRPVPKRRIPDFEINNTLAGRKIVDDDTNVIGGDPDFTIDGLIKNLREKGKK